VIPGRLEDTSKASVLFSLELDLRNFRTPKIRPLFHIIRDILTSVGGDSSMKTFLTTLVLSVTITGLAQTSTTTSLVADKQTVVLGTIFTLTATVTDAKGPIKLGQVTFYDGDPSGPAAALGTVVLNQANGTATLKRGFAIGSHAITAKFLGTNTDAPSSSSSPTITVTGKYASTTTLFTEGNGSSLKLIAKVAGQGLIPITGSVKFTDTTTNTVLGTSPLNSAVLRPKFANTNTSVFDSTESTVAGDFDGDGKLDLVTLAPNQGLLFYRGNGDGTFMPYVLENLPGVPGHPAKGLASGDFNGDGKLDLVLLLDGNGTFIEAALGHGDGTFQGLDDVDIGSDATSSPLHITAADFNGDGKLDLAVTANDPKWGINILLGHGNGTFDSSQKIDTPVNQVPLSVADLYGNSKADLLTIVQNRPQVYIGHGNGTFDPPITIPSTISGTNIAIGDFDGDGKQDFAMAGTNERNGTQAVGAFLSHGNGTFEEVDSLIALHAPGYVATGDLNNDGKVDVVVTDAGFNTSDFVVYLGHGNGTFLDGPSIPIPSKEIYNPHVPLLADFNNDGVIDFGANTPLLATVFVLNYGSSTAAAGLSGFKLTGGGSHTITATYSGDGNFTGSDHTGSVGP
jgi:hypothetical protein